MNEIRENETIAEGILRETARMRKEDSFDKASLCWGAPELEALAMYAIHAKNELLRASRAGDAPPDVHARIETLFAHLHDTVPSEEAVAHHYTIAYKAIALARELAGASRVPVGDATLREAVATYGRHLHHCAIETFDRKDRTGIADFPEPDCTCGFEGALARAVSPVPKENT